MKKRRILYLSVFSFLLVCFNPNPAQNKLTVVNHVNQNKKGKRLLIKSNVDMVKSFHNQNPPPAPKAMLSEGFEEPYGQWPPAGWTIINNDGGGKQWHQSTSFNHSGAHNIVVEYETPNDDWLITPRLVVATGDTFSFWARSLHDPYFEDFNVKVSKTGNSVSDFTITLEEVRHAPDYYVQYSYDLVGGGYGINDRDVTYIAIQCVSNNKWELHIDDVEGPAIYNPSVVPDAPSNPSPPDGATDISLSGTLTWDFGTNTDTYDLFLGPAGNMSQVVTNGTAGSSGSYSFSNLNYDTEYHWRVVAKNTSGGGSTVGPEWSFTTSLPPGQYQIGSGTNIGKHLPIEPSYDYSYSQTLYYASDFGAVGSNKRITKIYYNYSKASSGNHNNDDWVIYFATTTATGVSGWMPLSSLTKVFDGNSGYGDISSGDGWMEITLDRPFIYNPSTDGNLLVAVDENSAGGTSDDDEFYCDANPTTNVNIRVFTNMDIDPASPAGGWMNGYYPNTRFQFEDIPSTPEFTVSPESKDFGTVGIGDSPSTQTFKIANIGGGTLTIDPAPSLTATDAGDFSITDGNTYPKALGSNESMTIDVSFSPNSRGDKTAYLHIVDDASVSAHDLQLNGHAVNYNSGGNGSAYGGYYWSNSTSYSENSNPPTYNWIDPIANGHTEITSWTSGNDDNGYYSASIGFNFTFFGNPYGNCFIGTNGVITFTFGYSESGFLASIPSGNDPDNMIAGCLMDLDDMNDGKVYYGTDASGNFVVTWYHYHDYGDNNEWITFQIILKKNGNIKIQYNSAESQLSSEVSGSTIRGDALIGIENLNGSDGIQYRNDGSGGPILDTTAGKMASTVLEPISQTISDVKISEATASNLALEFGKDEGNLPVELTSFVANVNKRNISLNWETATEKDAYCFEIEKAIVEGNPNKPVWKKIGEVTASGNSNSPKKYSFTDKHLNSGKYEYRLKLVSIDGTYEYSNTIEAVVETPKRYSLGQNYPNPFNPVTKIEFSLPVDAKVKLDVYDVVGKKILNVLNADMNAGYHTTNLNMSHLSSGVYIYRLIAQSAVDGSSYVNVKKMILMK